NSRHQCSCVRCDVALEVASLISHGVVQCIALGSVRGLGLGTHVSTSGAGIEVPVGEAVLGRMLNLFGNPIDGLPAISDADRGSIHAAPPPLAERKPASEVLETGI